MAPRESLSDNSNVALVRLRTLLEEGSFDREQRLPPERVLAAEIGIGRRDLRRALKVLEGTVSLATVEGLWQAHGHEQDIQPVPRLPLSS
jgi:DNA-binding FadR family transcriptional regulator